MLNLKNIMNVSRKKEIVDERIEQQKKRILSQAGILLIVLAVLDVIIRGLILNLSPAFWGASFIYILVYSGFYFIQSSNYGVYNPEIENEKELNEKMKSHFWESIIAGIFFFIILMFFDGIPQSKDVWGEYVIKSVAIVILFQITERVFSKKSLKKNKTNG